MSLTSGLIEFVKGGNMEIILGNVPSKSNCYKIITFKGHASMTKNTSLKEYEKSFYIQCKMRDRNIKGFFELELDVYYPSMRSDLDNSLKIILDCLQQVKAIDNDNKCVKITARKFVDKTNPRIEFDIKEVKL